MTAFQVRKEVLPPGPRSPSAVQLAWVIARPTAYWKACAKRYGEPFTLRVLGLGTWVHYWSPEALRQIFTADEGALEAREGNRTIRPLFGPNSIFLLDGPVHLRRRRVLIPPLHGQPLLAHLDVIAELTNQVIAAWPVGRPFGLRPHMKTITLQVILRTVFGLDQGDQLRRLTADLTELLEVAGSPFLLFLPGMLDRAWFGPWKRFGRLLQRTRGNILSMVAARREAVDHPGHDVLSLLLRATDEEGHFMSDEELRDELISLLFAGHETTELALTWTLHLLLANPQALLRVREELASIQGRHGLDLARTLQLEYLDAVVKESLRLWPVVPAVGRRVMVPTQIGGWTIPVGVNVAPMIYLTHRRPDLYPDPDLFRPERFIGVKPDPYAWLPFGGGQRRCAGMAFALAEMKVVLATVLTAARLSLAPGPSVAPRTPRRLACANGPGARHPRRALELTGVLTAGVMCASRQECRSRPSVSDPSATVDACKANNCGNGGGSESSSSGRGTRRRPGRRRCARATSSTSCCLAASPRCSGGRCAWRARRAGNRFRAATACEDFQALR